MNDFRYILKPYKGPASRNICPGCGQRSKFSRYIDIENGEDIADHVGRCDRENNCGYHFTPKQFFTENPDRKAEFINTPVADSSMAEIKPVEYLPTHCWKAISGKYRKHNHFYTYLVSLFGEQIAGAVFDKYLIGTSNHFNGGTVFFQVDEQARLRTGKIMLYDPVTGKRVKSDPDRTTWVHYILNLKINFQQCFFGQHLLEEFPDKTVCITESEKSAVIASVYFPEFIWLATGGALGGCKWREYSVYKALQYRTVIFFPDYGYANKKTGKTCFQEWSERVAQISEGMKGSFKVSGLLENRLKDQERNDQDLIDVILKRDEIFQVALNDYNYPVQFDYPGFN